MESYPSGRAMETRSVLFTEQSETFLGLEGPLIFVPIFVWLNLHKLTHNMLLSVLAGALIFFFLKKYMLGKPPRFLHHVRLYLFTPRLISHLHDRHAFSPATIFRADSGKA